MGAGGRREKRNGVIPRSARDDAAFAVRAVPAVRAAPLFEQFPPFEPFPQFERSRGLYAAPLSPAFSGTIRSILRATIAPVGQY